MVCEVGLIPGSMLRNALVFTCIILNEEAGVQVTGCFVTFDIFSEVRKENVMNTRHDGYWVCIQSFLESCRLLDFSDNVLGRS